MQLHELKLGHQARVLTLAKHEPLYRKRLIAMGLIPGAVFTVVRVAPLGDPIEILVRGFSLSLRKDEASILQVEEV